MTSTSGTLPFASPAERVALQETMQRVQRARLGSEPARRVMEPVAMAGASSERASANGAAIEPVAPPTTSAAVFPAATAATAAEGGRPNPTAGERKTEGTPEGARKEPFEGVRDENELTPEEQKQVEELKARDQEVRAHEAAHKSAGGQYVRGSASFDYQTGPDGRRYAIGGEVKIDTGKEDEPEKTLEKAETIRRAAMAPAEPSDKDRQVAAEASRMAAEARSEIAQTRAAEARGEAPEEEGAAGLASEEGMGRKEKEEPSVRVGAGRVADDEQSAGAYRVPTIGANALGALNQFNATANAGRSTNLFVNVYA